jgi:purine-nucleoside phosphorylase
VGNILSSDMFYTPKTSQNGVSWSDMGVLAVEMETAALYSNAALGKADAISIFTISDSLITGESTSAEERQTSFTKMMETALKMV